ncbi:anti-sigma factor domain-containing protein [Marinicrinis sediminis]|uniref:Anti-sigma factor domain-containing protein n=1 Tax=Marinicrinis sediminis TaxID=1652465 RepID=A0ABW5R9F2_9BACL
MKKGLVMEIQKKSLVVMTRDGEFMQIPRGSRVCDLGEEILFPARSFRFPTRMYSLAAVCTAAMLMIVALFSGFNLFGKSVVAAYVTMDINPSIELGIDDEDVVVEATGLNPEGIKLLKEIEVEGLLLREAANVVMEEASPILERYMSEDGAGDIVLTSMVIKLEYEQEEHRFMQEMTEMMHVNLAERFARHETQLNVTVLSAPKELRQSAQNAGVSSGKLAVQLLAKQEGIDITTEQLEEKSIQQMSREIEGLSQVLKTHVQDSKQVLKNLLDEEKKKEQHKQNDDLFVRDDSSSTEQDADLLDDGRARKGAYTEIQEKAKKHMENELEKELEKVLDIEQIRPYLDSSVQKVIPEDDLLPFAELQRYLQLNERNSSIEQRVNELKESIEHRKQQAKLQEEAKKKSQQQQREDRKEQEKRDSSESSERHQNKDQDPLKLQKDKDDKERNDKKTDDHQKNNEKNRHNSKKDKEDKEDKENDEDREDKEDKKEERQDLESSVEREIKRALEEDPLLNEAKSLLKSDSEREQQNQEKRDETLKWLQQWLSEAS